jgi:hypothetical protein
MQIKGVKKLLTLLGLSAVSLFAFVGMPQTANGQTTTTVSGYPGPTSTTLPASTSTSQTVGPLAIGSTLSFQVCGYQNGSSVSLRLNGNSAISGNFTVASNGCATITMTASGTSSNVVVSINGNSYPAVLGQNSIVSNGTGVNGAPLIITTSFNITNPPSLAFTGFDIILWGSIIIVLVALALVFISVAKRRKRLSNS